MALCTESTLPLGVAFFLVTFFINLNSIAISCVRNVYALDILTLSITVSHLNG